MLIPAACPNCGLFFATPNLIGGIGIAFAAFTNSRVDCPRCNADANILDGLYRAIGEATHVIATSKQSADTLRALAGALEGAKERGATPEEVKATIKEQAPQLSSLVDLVPSNKEQTYQFTQAVCAIITMLIAAGAFAYQVTRPDGITEQQRNAIIDEAVRRAVGAAAPTPAPTTTATPPTKNRAQRRAERSPRAKQRR
ncbi:MAG TPA: hypothetical protein VGB98_13635 [Pyrinomonadaceae bacterium]|jgi:hypothetical protein